MSTTETVPRSSAPSSVPPAGGRPLAANLPAWVLAGALLGVLAGLVFGERMAVLRPVGIAYSMMLESVIYPYILSSVIGGLGGLARDRAIQLFKASWAVYVALWIIAFAAIFVLAQAIPPPPPPVEIVAAPTSDRFSLLEALIPSNVTAALVRNLVPAIVVFAVAFGIAVQSIPRKDAFLETMEVIRRASLEIWAWVVYLAPIGVFALFASTAGTIAPAMADTLAVYIGLYLIGTGVLAFVVLPLALSAIAPASARELLADLRPAFVLALVTTLPTSALPLIERVAEGVTARAGHAGAEANDVIRATISLSYVFASLGNYFTALFVVYASHNFQVPMDALDTALLPILTLLSCSGSPSTTIEAVKFVSEWLGLPASTVPLYVEAMTVTRYGQVALSVSAYGFATIAVPHVYYRHVAWRPNRAVVALAIGAVLLAGVATGTRMLSSRLFPPPSNAALLERTLDPALVAGVEAVVKDTPPSALPPIDGPATLEGIRARGVIRVGYGRDIVPFTYANSRRDLVGFDISYAYQLARDLRVRLELLPIDWTTLDADVAAHRFDIIMAGAYVTNSRLENLQVTDPYFQSPLALIARSAEAPRFLSYEAIAGTPRLTLGVLNYPALLPMVEQLFPNARIVPLASYDELGAHSEIDAAVWSADQARAWASAHRGYTAVVPSGMGAPPVFAYFLPPDAAVMNRFVNLWLGLQSSNGFRAAQIAYWTKGEPRARTSPRWNLLDNVLIPMLRRKPS
jgi:Na+/H+-dicarboxylate symporter/ABC-type amino acid transport substrate-binding protein